MSVPELAGAASASLYAVVTGPPRPAHVLANFPSAVYLSVPATSEAGPGADHDGVLALVTADALRLPCAIVLAASAELGCLGSGRPRAAVRVGAGRVELPGGSVRVARWWQPPSPRRLDLETPFLGQLDVLAACVPRLPALVRRKVRRLSRHLLSADASALAEQATGLVGLGPGLTPAGDDVLAALMLTLGAGPAPARRLAEDTACAVLAAAPARTTSLSAALLRHASRGEGLPQVVDLVDAVGSPERWHDVAPRLRELLAVGSSSGCALAHGVLVGARTMIALRGSTKKGLEVA